MPPFHTSQNGAESWQQLNNGLTDLDARGFVLHPQNPNQVYLWTLEGGLFTCSLPDCKWNQKNIGLPVLDLLSNSSSVFFPQNELEREMVTNTEDLITEDTKSVSYQPLNDLKFSISNPAIVYLATSASGVYRSNNGTESWSQAGLSGKNILKLALHPANSDVVYAVVLNSDQVYKTNNAGASWSNSQVPGGIVNDLAVNKDQPGVVLAATNSGVYKQTDGGVWQLLGLSGKMVTALGIHPDQPNLIAAGCPGAVYYSKDGGLNWLAGPGELMETVVKTVSFDPNKNDIVYLGTITQGIYRLLLR